MSETINLAEIPVEDMVKHLATQKMIVRTEEQDHEYWQKKEGDVIGGKLKEWSTNLESKIADLTKTERSPQENSLAFLERAIGSINETHTTTTKELEALRKSTAEGDSAATEIQKQFDTFKKSKEKEILDLSGKVGNMEGQQFKNRIDLAVQDAMSKIRPTLKSDKDNEKMIESAVENEINNFYKSTKAIDHQGTLIYHDEKDEPLLDKVSGAHLGALDLLKGRLDYLVDKTRVVGGSGSVPQFNGEPSGENKFKLQLPDTVKTKVQLTEFLSSEKKIDPNDPKFNKYFIENGQGLPLR